MKELRLPFLVGESKAQGGTVTHLRSHSSLVAELELEFRFQTPSPCITPPWNMKVGQRLAKRWNARRKMEVHSLTHHC